jgi:biotin operon repressor
MAAATSQPIEVMNLTTNEVKFYSSIRRAATELGITRVTIKKYIQNQKEYKNYIFTIRKK